MTIEIKRDNRITHPKADFYSVTVDGVTILDLQTQEELTSLTIREIICLFVETF